jgi:large subunit ribosomal protein L6
VSRIGKKPIEIPDGVTVNVGEETVAVKGPKGTLEKRLLAGIQLQLSENKLQVTREKDDRDGRSKQGLLRALIANMVTGVSKGFERGLEISGVGYRAEKTGDAVTLFLGFSHKVEIKIPEGIEIVIDKPTHVVVKGIDREKVGQVAAKIRSLRRPDPYKAKGIIYEGERILRKVGKKAIS